MSACPKCRFELQEGALECPACGIVIEKYLALGSGPVSTVAEERGEPTAAGPPPRPSSNPYAPPVAVVAPRTAPAGEASVSADVITRLTVESLQKARPWMRFLALYGMVLMTVVTVGAILLLFTVPSDSGQGMALFAVYLCYALILAALVFPLSASSKAIRELGTSRTSAALEEFAVQQTKFWRRAGILNAVSLSLILLALLAVLLGVGASLLK